jgi:hypothetical protein
VAAIDEDCEALALGEMEPTVRESHGEVLGDERKWRCQSENGERHGRR